MSVDYFEFALILCCRKWRDYFGIWKPFFCS
uniref:Uncharacterized protein n=1 Tax=Anguilla anguilla TaxID=7936 RepID=A0A0E9RBL5_ANGAN